MEGRTPCYTVSSNVYRSGQSAPDCDLAAAVYRLPKSDEWEYAARGGLSSQRFPWGDTITHSNANYYSKSSFSYDTSATRGSHPAYNDGTAPSTSPVGVFGANGYGLYDMAGNVREWCSDWHPDYVGSFRVVRGGACCIGADYARCGRVYTYYPFDYYYNCGFRSVLPAK